MTHTLPDLPRDLIDRGFKLIRLEKSGRLMAVSANRGGSVPSLDFQTVIKSARAIAQHCEQRERRSL
jgi:hypothetical protein